MLTEVSPGNGNTSITLPLAPARPAWWARLLARIPLRALYGFAGLLGWLAFRAFPYRQHVVRENLDRKSTRLNSSHSQISYAVFCLKKKKGRRVRLDTGAEPSRDSRQARVLDPLERALEDAAV